MSFYIDTDTENNHPFALMRYLYRIQHKKSGIGPYRHEYPEGIKCGQNHSVYTVACFIKWKLDVSLFSENHPMPYDDKLLDERKHCHVLYGFQSLAKMRQWFTGNSAVYDILKEYGFILMRFEVSERLDGRKQSCARKDHLFNGKEMDFARVYGA